MEYITFLDKIDEEEVEEILASKDITMDEILEVWDKYEATYDYWAETYGIEIMNEWLEEHWWTAINYNEAMVYGIQEFVKWINRLN